MPVLRLACFFICSRTLLCTCIFILCCLWSLNSNEWMHSFKLLMPIPKRCSLNWTHITSLYVEEFDTEEFDTVKLFPTPVPNSFSSIGQRRESCLCCRNTISLTSTREPVQTRKSNNSTTNSKSISTCLDIILTNVPAPIKSSDVLETGLTGPLSTL